MWGTQFQRFSKNKIKNNWTTSTSSNPEETCFHMFVNLDSVKTDSNKTLCVEGSCTIKMDSNMMQCADEPRYQTSEKHHLCWWILYQWHRFRLNKASTDGLMIMTVSLHKERYRHATDSTDSCKQFSGMTTVNVTQKPAVTRENHQECQPESVCGNHWTQAMNAKH